MGPLRPENLALFLEKLDGSGKLRVRQAREQHQKGREYPGRHDVPPSVLQVQSAQGDDIFLAPRKGQPQGLSDGPTAPAGPAGRLLWLVSDPDYAVLGKRPG